MAKLADAPDLGSGAARHVGSTPSIRTFIEWFIVFFISINQSKHLINNSTKQMATVTRENIGLLNDKITVEVVKNDYLPSFEKNLKSQAKSANIPGFRKGMVPPGMVKKMYGQSLLTDEIFRLVEKELTAYIEREQLNILAQPLPFENDVRAVNVNNPSDYSFQFEIGLKPEIEVIPEDIFVTRFKVEVTEEMINEEVNRLQIRNGKMTEPETIESDDTVLNIQFTEVDAEKNIIEGGISKTNNLPVKYFNEECRKKLIGKKKDDTIIIQINNAFEDKERETILQDLGLDKNNVSDGERFFKMEITKIGLVQKSELTEEFFETVYPGKEIKTEQEFRNAVKVEIEAYYDSQSRNQVHDQIYHYLIDNIPLQFPEDFLKRWLQKGSEKPKTAEEAEADYPSFANQLKWSLISSKLIKDNSVSVEPDEIKEQARKQILSYMNQQSFTDAPWMDEYVNRMMSDKKFVEETYYQLQTQKLFTQLETKVKTAEQPIGAEEFSKKLHHHH